LPFASSSAWEPLIPRGGSPPSRALNARQLPPYWLHSSWPLQLWNRCTSSIPADRSMTSTSAMRRAISNRSLCDWDAFVLQLSRLGPQRQWGRHRHLFYTLQQLLHYGLPSSCPGVSASASLSIVWKRRLDPWPFRDWDAFVLLQLGGGAPGEPLKA
jgi:hypothetical protein